MNDLCPLTRGSCAWKGCAWWCPTGKNEGVCIMIKIGVELENLRKLKQKQLELEESEKKENRLYAEEQIRKMRRENDESASKGGV